mmetsp:Transcript_22644/g.67944  ORF Transcript_22644/g.67944 Transcript_22644/m.67944 type:complete len:341 (-) Transcript_22644:23-1045(-)
MQLTAACLFVTYAAALRSPPRHVAPTLQKISAPARARRDVLAAGLGLSSLALTRRASAAVELDDAQRAEIAAALEKAVKETAAASVAATKVAGEFLDDPATKKLVEDASKVAAEAGAAAGAAAWDLTQKAADGTLTQTAKETADVLSLPVRIAEAAAKDGDSAKAIAEAVDAWTKLPGVQDLTRASASTAADLTNAAVTAAKVASADVAKRAKTGELVDDVKNVAKVATDVSATIGLDKAASGVSKAVGDATVDVLAAAVGDPADLDKKISSAGASVSQAVEAASKSAPGVAGFVVGFAFCGLLNFGKDGRIEAQEREIGRLKKDLDRVVGLKKIVGIEE